MIHYHGGPITPQTCALVAWRGRHAFVAYDHKAHKGRDIELAATICQSFALDNGAFSAWRSDVTPDWDEYRAWAESWLSHPACDWAVIPDVIGGTEDENDALLDAYPRDGRWVPVWHLNESPERLVRIAESWPRVALGSAAEFDVANPRACLGRLAAVLPLISLPCGRPKVKLHGLRMLRPEIVTRVPLSSGDSCNVAHNVGMDGAWAGPYEPSTKETRAAVLVDRMESHDTPDRMTYQPPPAAGRLFDLEP